MLGWRDVPDEPDVAGPGEVGRIARAAEHEALRGPAPRRLDEQSLERRLPVRRVGAEVREIGAEALIARSRPVRFRVDMAVERRDVTRTETLPKCIERGAACITQHQVEVAQALF